MVNHDVLLPKLVDFVEQFQIIFLCNEPNALKIAEARINNNYKQYINIKYDEFYDVLGFFFFS